MTAAPLSRRAQVARRIARFELVLAVVAGFAVGPFLYVAAPGYMGGTPSLGFIPAVGLGLATVGFLWMLRIYRDSGGG